ncbi:MAG: DUF3795 domain-containing protein [Deltaproteobacteria bacterium]|nr:DUF3795 domain-containing protein [Deltaproteobacteria bacterium]
MKQSYCGLCENCPIETPGFLKAIAKVKEYLDQLSISWWAHCFPGEEGFSFPEFRKGLDWFLRQPECRGCKGGGGLKDCLIRRCAITRQVAHCWACHDLETCEHFNIIIQESPGNVVYLHRYLLKNGFGNLQVDAGYSLCLTKIKDC